MPSTVFLKFPKKPICVYLHAAEYWNGGNGKGFAVFIVKPTAQITHIHNLFVAKGAKHRYKEFHPHISIGMEVGSLTHEIEEWLQRTNDAIKSFNTALYFSRIRIQNLVF